MNYRIMKEVNIKKNTAALLNSCQILPQMYLQFTFESKSPDVISYRESSRMECVEIKGSHHCHHLFLNHILPCRGHGQKNYSVDCMYHTPL